MTNILTVSQKEFEGLKEHNIEISEPIYIYASFQICRQTDKEHIKIHLENKYNDKYIDSGDFWLDSKT